MSYLINRYNGEQLVVLEDGTLDTTTSLGLLGRNYTGYGEIQNENFLFLLENFSNDTPPFRPISGQLWYNRQDGSLNIYDGVEWRKSATAEVSDVEPAYKTNGSFWFDSDSNQLFVYNNESWRLVGPEGIEGFDDTRFRSETLLDTSGIPHPVILTKINGIVIGIISNTDFTPRSSNAIPGFTTVTKGLNLISTNSFVGNLKGNADSATRLQTERNINGVPFSGVSDITITASTPNVLVPGDYIDGSNFNGSVGRQWSIRASSDNIIGKLVARDSQGNFSAGIISADLVGNVTGNVTAETGTSVFNVVRASEFIGANLVGNAFTATALETSRAINGVLFNGTSDITITADAFTLTNTRLAPNIVESSLTTVGVLDSVFVENLGVQVGSTLKAYHDTDVDLDILQSNNENGLVFSATSTGDINLTRLYLTSPLRSSALGMEGRLTLRPAVNGSANIGGSQYRYNRMFSNLVDSPIVNTQTINSTSQTNSVTIDSNLIVSGNLVVNGVTTLINSTEIAIDDLTFTIAKNAASPTAANGAGIYVSGALAQFSYSATGDKWTMNKSLDVGNNNIMTTALFQGTATSARYADLAENYLADYQYEPGTVLDFGGEKEVTVSTEDSQKIAGIVSEKPAYLMNSSLTGDFVVALALQGRVPCKVRGPVKKGDMLVSAGCGYAKADHNPRIGSVIGKALEDFDDIEGSVEVVVGRL